MRRTDHSRVALAGISICFKQRQRHKAPWPPPRNAAISASGRSIPYIKASVLAGNSKSLSLVIATIRLQDRFAKFVCEFPSKFGFLKSDREAERHNTGVDFENCLWHLSLRNLSSDSLRR
jgi:hypothetical protein